MESSYDIIALGHWQNKIRYEISKAELSSQDLAINLDELTELQDSSIFNLGRRDSFQMYDRSDLL